MDCSYFDYYASRRLSHSWGEVVISQVRHVNIKDKFRFEGLWVTRPKVLLIFWLWRGRQEGWLVPQLSTNPCVVTSGTRIQGLSGPAKPSKFTP